MVTCFHKLKRSYSWHRGNMYPSWDLLVDKYIYMTRLFPRPQQTQRTQNPQQPIAILIVDTSPPPPRTNCLPYTETKLDTLLVSKNSLVGKRVLIWQIAFLDSPGSEVHCLPPAHLHVNISKVRGRGVVMFSISYLFDHWPRILERTEPLFLSEPFPVAHRPSPSCQLWLKSVYTGSEGGGGGIQ